MNYLPKVTQTVNGGARICTHTVVQYTWTFKIKSPGLLSPCLQYSILIHRAKMDIINISFEKRAKDFTIEKSEINIKKELSLTGYWGHAY